MPDSSYTTREAPTEAAPESAETPLEAAARQESEAEGRGGQDRREEREADRVIADVDEYVARTDPSALPEAEQALNDWEIPTDPLAGVPGDVALAPGVEGPPLVSVFEAGSETEANIVRGLLEAEGIPVTFDGAPASAFGGALGTGIARWGALLVPPGEAETARAVLASAQQAALPDNASE